MVRLTKTIDECKMLIARPTPYSREHLEDMTDIRDWVWTED